METHKTIGILSDTHLHSKRKSLPAQIFSSFSDCDLIFHAGDILDMGVIQRLGEIAPTFAVAGNNDPPELLKELGDIQYCLLNNFKAVLCHGHQGKGTAVQNIFALSKRVKADLFIFGHSHKPMIHQQNGLWFINPGSPTNKRMEPFYSLVKLHLKSGEIHPELIRW
ncbi:MAG: YfcE family phosphodiesterase [Bacteroidetes bacterium]|nr:YfcE family phosphodiesterase [Bacteroidota bacterium]